MKFLVFLAAGLYVAYRMEKRIESQKQNKYNEALRKEREFSENLIDETLDESFPASDPPNFSSSGYHH